MAIKPILFNTEMVRAILDGRKTCTRRVIKPQPTARYGAQCIKPPYQSGDILYVRETWKRALNGYYYYEDWQRDDIADITKWKPSIHMPKEAARIWLKVTNVRVERLQDITSEQIYREGVEVEYPHVLNGEEKRYAFSTLWDSTIKKADLDRYGLDANPWVWVIEFEMCEKPEGV
jgi:hypothetical protein